MKLLILTETNTQSPEDLYSIFKSDLVLRIRLDGTYDVLKNRYGLDTYNLTYNEIHDTSPTNNFGKLDVKVQNEKINV